MAGQGKVRPISAMRRVQRPFIGMSAICASTAGTRPCLPGLSGREFVTMRTFGSVAFASAIAASSVALSAGGASAGGWHHHGPYPQTYNYYYTDNGAGALAAGAIIGLTFGALASQAFAPSYYYPPPPPPVYPTYAYSDPHASWCAAHFPDYNPDTNTWADYYGVIHVCTGPY
jgi:hypothetical protein